MVPELQSPTKAVKQLKCIKLCFEPGPVNQDSPFLHYCDLFYNFQEGSLQCYKIKVIPVHTIKAYRSGGTVPLILNLGTRWGEWLASRLARLLYSS
jgi:hypothetical protein